MRLWPWSRKANEDGSVRHSADLFALLFGGRPVKSGASVTTESSLEVTAVLGCARVIAEGIAQVPFRLFRRDGKSILPAAEHPLYRVLHRRPNAWMTSFGLRETMALHVVLTGDAVAFVGRDMKGMPRELIPLKPGDVKCKQLPDYRLEYEVTAPNGKKQTFPQGAIWHWRGPSWDGVVGLDVVKQAREAIGLAMMTEESHALLHKNGARVSGTYSVDGKLDKEQHRQLSAWIAENYGGENAGKPLILDRNAKFQPATMTGVDAQHLETRRYQIEEICRAFRVMPIMIGYSDKASTYASAEQMFLAHVVHTLAPWYERIEQTADCQLLTEQELDDGYFVKFSPAGLMRGSHKDRSEYFAKALGAGGSPAWMTVDEIRALEELNPMGGDAAQLPKLPGKEPPDADPEPDVQPA